MDISVNPPLYEKNVPKNVLLKDTISCYFKGLLLTIQRTRSMFLNLFDHEE